MEFVYYLTNPSLYLYSNHLIETRN